MGVRESRSGRRRLRRLLAGLVLAAAAALSGCGGGGDDRLVAWTNEFEPDRVERTERLLADFTKRTGIAVDLVPVPENQLPHLITKAAAVDRLPDVVLATTAAESHLYAQEGIFDADAAQEVVDRLGPGTFSRRALDLVSRRGRATGVPSDGWGQLLIYRRDWFRAAGIPEPRTLGDVVAAAAALDRPDRAGIALATATGDAFTAESFEHVALAVGCQLVDARGRVGLDAPPCVRALRTYRALAAHGPRGPQDVESTRAAYFSGRAAMVFWSPFLLEGMAGLGDAAPQGCLPCRRSPGYLARRSGLVGALAAPSGASQFGSVSTFNITTTASTDAAQDLVEYLMSDGYLQWLALAPQGKVPVRAGDARHPDRFRRGWTSLGVGRPGDGELRDYYAQRSLRSLLAGVESFQRWGFAQGHGALVGALGGEQPIAEAVSSVVAGEDPARAARDARETVEDIASTLR